LILVGYDGAVLCHEASFFVQYFQKVPLTQANILAIDFDKATQLFRQSFKNTPRNPVRQSAKSPLLLRLA
jgi:predicted Ser/Thr protein kinase